MDERGLYCAHAIDLGFTWRHSRTIVRLAETLQLKGASVTAPKFTIVTAMLGRCRSA